MSVDACFIFCYGSRVRSLISGIKWYSLFINASTNIQSPIRLLLVRTRVQVIIIAIPSAQLIDPNYIIQKVQKLKSTEHSSRGFVLFCLFAERRWVPLPVYRNHHFHRHHDHHSGQCWSYYWYHLRPLCIHIIHKYEINVLCVPVSNETKSDWKLHVNNNNSNRINNSYVHTFQIESRIGSTILFFGATTSMMIYLIRWFVQKYFSFEKPQQKSLFILYCYCTDEEHSPAIKFIIHIIGPLLFRHADFTTHPFQGWHMMDTCIPCNFSLTIRTVIVLM